MRTFCTKTLACSVLFLLFISYAIPSEAQVLGANYNEGLNEINSSDITRGKTRWVRAFVPVTKLVNINNSGVITGINTTAISGLSADLTKFKNLTSLKIDNVNVKLILSLKYDFKFRSVGVPDVNSQETTYLVDATKALMQTSGIAAASSIVVIGNEPMFETELADAEKLRKLYLRLIDKLDAWKAENSTWKYQIYIGAINRASDLATNDILNKLVVIANSNSKVTGLDAHIHYLKSSEIVNDLKTLRETKKVTKPIIVTEFSPQRLLAAHFNDNLGTWGTQNGYSSTLKVYSWLNGLINRAATDGVKNQNEVNSYFNAQSWYTKDFMRVFYKAFCTYKVSVATYGITRNAGGTLTATSAAWVLNPVFNKALFGTTNNQNRTNPLVWRTFIGINNKTITCSNAAVVTDAEIPIVAQISPVQKVQVAPNPSTGIFTLQYQNGDAPYVVSIRSVNGKMLHNQLYTDSTVSFDTNQLKLSKGLYIVTVQQGAAMYNEKIVITQ